MKKIDKSTILSKVYKAWEEDLENNLQNHPKYNSSNFRFYKDIVMNLYHCQNGLCAYTEKELLSTDENHFDIVSWSEEGKYLINELPSHLGTLDHFDESLKTSKAWLWDNFFMVLSQVNGKKRTKPIDNILKPDSPEYDPFSLLAYNHEEHIFYPKPTLNENLIKRIEDMIDTLGLNYVKDWRKKYISERIKAIEFGLDPDPAEEYITAYTMTRRNLNL